MDRIKGTFIVVVTTVMSWLGMLAIPVFLMVGCNVIDYVTGIVASEYRDEAIRSYKGIRGIVKKICMWLLVLIGSWIDILVNYATELLKPDLHIPFVVSTAVCIWIVSNEIISILENMVDIGLELPPFLMPLVKRIKFGIEEKAVTEVKNEEK